MQIILLEKVQNLGGLGDVVKVKDGYARNFLIPQGKAKRATQSNLAEFESRRAELERAHAEKLAAAQELAAKLEGVRLECALQRDTAERTGDGEVVGGDADDDAGVGVALVA